MSDAELPNYVSIAPNSTSSARRRRTGFLGPDFAPLTVGTDGIVPPQGKGDFDYGKSLGVKNLALPDGVSQPQTDARLNLLAEMEQEFRDGRGGTSAFESSIGLRSGGAHDARQTAQAFDLSSEPAQLRDA